MTAGDSQQVELPDADLVRALFSGPDGAYLCARWRRPIVPIIFGVDDATLATLKGGIEAVAKLAGHGLAETDPEQGANLMVFFFRDWSELRELPDVARLLGFEDQAYAALITRLGAEGANQYRLFRFEADGAIRAAFVFLRMDGALADMPAEDLALAQAAQVMLSWAEGAMRRLPPLVRDPESGVVMLHPGLSALIRAAYDPVMPDVARDASHALRLAARVAMRAS